MAWSMLWKKVHPMVLENSKPISNEGYVCEKLNLRKEFDGVWIWLEFRGNSFSLLLLTVEMEGPQNSSNQHSLRALCINIYNIFYITYYIYYIYIIYIIHFSWKKWSLKAIMTWWAKFSITVTDNPYIWYRH